jgi:hypothetical protein
MRVQRGEQPGAAGTEYQNVCFDCFHLKFFNCKFLNRKGR